MLGREQTALVLGREGLADGWLDSATGLYRGRPVDVAMMKDGSMLIRDDFAGALYRVSYVGDAK